MATQIEELEATLRELEAQIASTPAEMRGPLALQVDSLKSTIGILRAAAPEIEAMKAQRVPVSPEVATLFTPEPAAAVPAWLPDTLTRDALDEPSMRCPPGAKVYRLDTGSQCAIPGVPGVRIASAHGLDVTFQSDGTIASQSFFENGCLRWSITYHSTGGRDRIGFYVSPEPKTYIEQGLHTRYAPNGTIISQASYVNGQHHGWDKKWEDDGYPIGATRFEHGREVESVYPNGERRTP